MDDIVSVRFRSHYGSSGTDPQYAALRLPQAHVLRIGLSMITLSRPGPRLGSPPRGRSQLSAKDLAEILAKDVSWMNAEEVEWKPGGVEWKTGDE